MKKLSKKERQKKIDNCGKTGAVVFTGNGTPMYIKTKCGLMGCPMCRAEELAKRKAIVVKMLSNAEQLCTVIVSKEDANGFRHKLSRNSVDFLSVPQNDGSVLLISDQSISFKSYCLEVQEISDVIAVATTDSNLFVNGRRSTGGNWSLSEPPNEFDEKLLMIDFDFFKVFLNPPHDDKKQLYLLEKFRMASNFYCKQYMVFDPSTPESVQQYVDHFVSAYIELALQEGFTIDYEQSRIEHLRRSQQEIAEKWIDISLTVEYGNDSSRDYLMRSNPWLVSLIEGHRDVPNWRLKYLNWREQQNRFPEELQWAFGE